MGPSLKRFVFVTWTLLLAAAVASATEGAFRVVTAVPAEYSVGFSSITESDSEQVLRHLVEGDMAGRGTGQEGSP